jgi:dTDP-4-amino-4,6-dideoxygalactose transaminase
MGSSRKGHFGKGGKVRVQFGSPSINAAKLSTEIKGILLSGWVSIGEYVEGLEDIFERKFGVKHAIGTNCATTGLIIALKAAGWQANEWGPHAVNLPAFTWPSTLYAVNCVGGEPIFHDIDPDTWLMKEPHHNHGKLLLVDTFGSSAEHFEGFAKEDTIIDAAHGFGNEFLGKRGIAEVVSLSFTKVVTGMEGGMILTDDDRIAETATELRRLSGRMGEINALIALQSIRDYTPSISQFAVNHYKKHITVPYKCQEVLNDTNNSVFSLRFENTAVRDAIRIALEKKGIETKVYHEPLDHVHAESQKLYNTILSLPTHHEAMQVQDEIIETINDAGRSAGTPGMRYLKQ